MAEAKSTVTIEAEVRLCVSDDTAMTCLNIVQQYLNMHNDKKLVEHMNPDGTYWYEIADAVPDDWIVRVKPRRHDVRQDADEVTI